MDKKSQVPSELIEKRVLVQASAEVVFRALTEASALEEWFCDRASGDLEEGGELTATWRAGRKSIQGRARVARFQPGELLELLWIDDGAGVAGSPTHRIIFSIRRRRTSSEVIISDQDSKIRNPEALRILTEGWNGVLFELKAYCEQMARSQRSHPGDPE